MALLSICIATYNRGSAIAETLNSIVNNGIEAVDIVIVDGASPDNTAEVVSRYTEKYPQIRYFKEDVNSGVDCDYDKAISYATGEYCWLMPDDDLMVPGAIKKVLAVLDSENSAGKNNDSSTLDLCLVNSEVKSSDLSKLLQNSRIKATSDKRYSGENIDDLMKDTGDLLSFIGSVIIKRTIWIERDRETYYGSLFIHVGVIFQSPLIESAYLIADPLISIRYGNAMWTSRMFEIWMFKWPALIWGFSAYSDVAKDVVTARNPWANMMQLLKYRAKGGYSIAEYKKYLGGNLHGYKQFLAYAITLVPVELANLMAIFYVICFNREARLGLYDLVSCQCFAWPSRVLVNLFPLKELE